MGSGLVFRGFPLGQPRRLPRRHGAEPLRFAARTFAGEVRRPSIDMALLMTCESFTRTILTAGKHFAK